MAEAIIKERNYGWLWLALVGAAIFMLTFPSVTSTITERGTTSFGPDNLCFVLVISAGMILSGLILALSVSNTYKIVGKKYLLKEKKEIEKTEETWEEVKGGN